MTEAFVTAQTRQPDAQRNGKEAKQPPKDVYELLHHAIDAAQGHRFLQWFNSTKPWKDRYDASSWVATLADGQNVHLGTRKDSRGKKVYGLIKGLQFDESGNLQDDVSGKERVYRTDDDLRELFGDTAKDHAARILSRIAMDKIKLPKALIEHADEMGLASIAPSEKDGSAVVYVPDRKTGKIIRFFTERPLPETDEGTATLIAEVKNLIHHESVQEGLRRTFFRAVDIVRDKGDLWINSSGEVRDPANRVSIVNLVPGERVGTDVDVEINDHYVFPSKDKLRQKRQDIEKFREKYHVEPEEQADKNVDSPTTVLWPGWSMGGVTDSAERVGYEFANEYNTPTLLLDSRPEQLVEDSYWKEAQAMVELIKSERRRKITLVGHSQGGIKAAYAALILQRERKEAEARGDIVTLPEVEGLVLIDPMGMYEQEPGELAKGFIGDSVRTGGTSTMEMLKYWRKRFMGQPETGSSIAHDAGKLMPKRGVQAIVDIVGKGAGREMIRSGIGYKARLTNEIKNMAAFSEEHQARLAELECSIVMMHGREDPISDPEKIVPGYATMNLSQREAALRKSIFKNARSIQMITATDMGRHGLPLFRPETTAIVARRLLTIATNPDLYPVRSMADIETE